MDNYYFTFWIAKHGRENFKKLTTKVCSKINVPLKIKEQKAQDEYLFHYFWVVYCTIALNYFGLNINQIAFFIDLSMAVGTCKMFPPKEILKVQKDVIPEIENYIREDLKVYDN